MVLAQVIVPVALADPAAKRPAGQDTPIDPGYVETLEAELQDLQTEAETLRIQLDATRQELAKALAKIRALTTIEQSIEPSNTEEAPL